MTVQATLKVMLVSALCLTVAACGNRRGAPVVTAGDAPSGDNIIYNRENEGINYERSSIWDVFGPNTSDQKVQVNRYLWGASLDVLNFLPIQSVDPFTGVIITGYGTPPGGGRSYRATVHIKDPALEARSLNVALQSKSGPVSAATTRAVEDAILTRARQLRVNDGKL